jgi:hypothetical protein
MTEGPSSPSRLVTGGPVEGPLDGSWFGPPVEMRLAVDALAVMRAMAAVGRASDAWFALGAAFGVLAFGVATAGDLGPGAVFALAALACLTGAGEIASGWSRAARAYRTSAGAVAVIDGGGIVLVDGAARCTVPWASISRAVDAGIALVTFVSGRPVVLETASVPPDGLDAVRNALRHRGLLARPRRFRRALLTIGLLAAMAAYSWLSVGNR